MRGLRLAFRQLLKSPGFTAVAMLTLALGIGANTAIYSVVHRVLLQPLPYPESERLVSLCERGLDWDEGSIAYPNYVDWRAQQSTFEHLGFFHPTTIVLTERGEPVQLRGAHMSAAAFAALQVPAALGRLVREEDDRPGAPPVAVISHALWQSRLGGDLTIVNQTIRLDGAECTVVGVMPGGFAYPEESTLWLPVGSLCAQAFMQNRNNHPGLYGLGRLKPGVALSEARADLDVIARRLEAQYPDTNKNRRVRIDRLLDNMVGGVRRSLWILLAAVGLVLGICCANVASLQLARAVARQKEMAVRAALGASRWQLLRQLMAESALLAALGGAGGLLVAHATLRLIVGLAGASIPRADGIGLDGPALLFSGALVLLTSLLFGVAPAWQSSRPVLQEALKDAARGVTGGQARLRRALIVGEVAVTMILLLGAGLLLRSFHHLQEVRAGFVHERVLSFRVGLPERTYAGAEPVTGFYRRLLEGLRALPGVQAASITSRVPMDGGAWDTTFIVEGRPELPRPELPSMFVQTIDPDYFRTVGMPILRGRAFTERDDRAQLRGTGRETVEAGLNIVIIDDAFAQRHWPEQDPIGQRIRMDWGSNSPVMSVVGVVPTVKWTWLGESKGLVQAYLPAAQIPINDMSVVIKTASEPKTVLASARAQVHALDPAQPIFDVRTLSEIRDRSVASQRVNFVLLGLFAAAGLGLAVIGLYGLLAFTVEQRTREIGVRMALGARLADVRQLVVGQGMVLVLLGSGFGLAGALALTQALRSLLFEVKPIDPLTFVVAPAVLLAATLAACWIPASRAARVDPMEALRHE